MYTFSGIKTAKFDVATSYLALPGNLQRCPVVPTKLQVRECFGCLNIRDVRCDVGATVYM